MPSVVIPGSETPEYFSGAIGSSSDTNPVLHNIAEKTNSVEPTPYVVLLTKLYVISLPMLRLSMLPLPSPEFLFELYTVKQVAFLLYAFNHYLQKAGFDDYVLLMDAETTLLKDSLQLLTDRKVFFQFLDSLISSDSNVMSGGGMNTEKDIINSMFKGMNGGGGQGSPNAGVAPSAAAVPNAGIAAAAPPPPAAAVPRPPNTTAMTVAQPQAVLGAGTGLGQIALASASAQNAVAVAGASAGILAAFGLVATHDPRVNQLVKSGLLSESQARAALRASSVIGPDTLAKIGRDDAERSKRLAKYFGETRVVQVEYERLREIINGGNIDALRPYFENTTKSVLKFAESRFSVKGKKGRKGANETYSLESAKLNLEEYKQGTKDYLGKNAKMMSLAAAAILGCGFEAKRSWDYIYKTSPSSYTEVKSQMPRGQKVQLKQGAVASWKRGTVTPFVKSTADADTQAALNAYRATRANLVEGPPPAPQPRTVVVKRSAWSSWALGSSYTTVEQPTNANVATHRAQVAAHERQQNNAKNPFVLAPQVEKLGEKAELLNPLQDFEVFERCPLGQGFNPVEYKCLDIKPPSAGLVWDSERGEFIATATLSDGRNCFSSATYVNGPALGAATVAGVAGTVYLGGPVMGVAAAAGTYASLGYEPFVTCAGPITSTIASGMVERAGYASSFVLLPVCLLALGFGGIYIGDKLARRYWTRPALEKKADTELDNIARTLSKSWDAFLLAKLKESLLTKINEELANFTSEFYSSMYATSAQFSSNELLVEIDKYLTGEKTNTNAQPSTALVARVEGTNRPFGRVPDSVLERFRKSIRDNVINGWRDTMKAELKAHFGERAVRGVSLQNQPEVLLADSLIDKVASEDGPAIFAALRVLQGQDSEILKEANGNEVSTFEALGMNPLMSRLFGGRTAGGSRMKKTRKRKYMGSRTRKLKYKRSR